MTIHRAVGSLLMACAVATGPVSPAIGHEKEKHAETIGQKGDPVSASRTIEVTMSDNVFQPQEISVEPGETVRFVVKNSGEFVHEFNIGNHGMHLAHREEMMMMVKMGVLEADRINHQMMGHGANAMKHDDPNSILLEPGASGEIIWTFPKSAKLQFGCNVPGHYEDGMVGEFEINPDIAS